MSIIVSGLKSGLNNAISLFKPTVLDKEYFLKQLKKISRDTVHVQLYKDELASNLIYKYEGRKDEVPKWLIEIAQNKENDTNYRKQAVSLFNYYITDNPDIVECLKKCLEDNHSGIREAAINKLSLLKDKNLISLFAKYLNNEDYFICRAAANAIAETKAPEALQILEAKRNEPECFHKNILDDALDTCLETIGYKLIHEFRHGLIIGPEEEMKSKRAEILKKITAPYGEERLLEGLVSIALDQDNERRDMEEAIKCLEEADREKAFKALIKGMLDRS